MKPVKPQMPHSREAEVAVLGACLLDARALAVAMEILAPRDFYDPRHAAVFEAMVDLADRGEPVDLVTVSEELKARDRLEQVGGVTFLAGLVDSVLVAGHAEHYARIVREMAQRRELIQAAQEITRRALDLDAPVEAVLEVAERSVFAAVQRDAFEPRLADRIVAERWQQLYGRRNEPPDTIETGFVDLDRYTGGLQRGALSVVAARPSMGKSLLAQQIAVHAARRWTVLLFTPEMSGEEIADRLISRWTGIDLVRIRSKRLTEPEWEAGLRAVMRNRIGRLLVDDTAGITSREIRSRARRVAMREKVDLIIVDYLQYLADEPERGQSRNDLIGVMTRRLKALARELGCAMLLLSQLSRAPERRASKRPELADLRDSGNIEQDADLVILLHRPSYYDPEDKPGIAELIIAKQRNGPVGTVELQFDPKAGFRDLARPWQRAQGA